MSSCRKDDITPNEPFTPAKAQNVKELKVSAQFNWETSKDIQIDLKGFQSDFVSSAILNVKTEEGITVLNQNLKSNENLQTRISVPSYAKKLIFSYGSLSKTVDIKPIVSLNLINKVYQGENE
jgi:hypothetical protein